MDSRRSENLGQLKRLIRLKYFGAKCELRPRKGNEAMPQQQVAYRIKNERTGQWWEGKADSPIDAMRKAGNEFPVRNPKFGYFHLTSLK
ncbi:hypothetical protein [Dehalococcoides mccartyi]|uniref:Uncharacterized protein n=2 Tax=Dehalococcoides mccartyi TaxID=61435 RepID=Q3Z9S6_DEHM1|nr:hypothetical protein [Dehalococcoides mccartyi]AAW40425.1 hypothetical protein DET0275 [Dehalococcoides mccartyi 195]